MGVSLRKADSTDCEKIHNMQVVSFKELLDKYDDRNTSPGAESLEKILSKMNQDNTDYYIIQSEGEEIGAIRVVRLHENICRISPMFLLPEYQGKGLAQQTILAIEKEYPQAAGWRLDTIKEETKLCHLYEKMGYKPTGKEEKIQANMTIRYYEK